MTEWKEVKLGDVIGLMSGGTPNKQKKEYWNGTIPWISAKTMYVDYISTSDLFITQKGLENGSKLAPIGTILLLTRGSGLFNNIPLCKVVKPVAFNQDVKCIFSKDENIITNEFLYYWLYGHKTNISNILETTGIGAGKIDTQRFLSLSIQIPSIEEQNKLVACASSIIKKTETNNKINAKLEEMAQAIFKHWFVDFAPFKDDKFVESELGLIPEGWRMCTLGEICKCELGGTPSRANKSYWGGNIAWINSGEVNKFRICEASEFITEEGLNHSATKLLPSKTTVLAITGATLGQISLLEIDSCANQSVVGVKENETIPYTFIYPAIKYNISKLVNMQTGGAQQHINKENIQSLQIIEPPKNIMEEYKSITLPLYDDISKLCFENLRLATLRDTLLPKLMSGEIKI